VSHSEKSATRRFAKRPHQASTNGEKSPLIVRHRLVAFRSGDAQVLLQWVRTPLDLRWLAPNTSWPLTEEKILAWTARGGEALVLRSTLDDSMIGYGEVNAFEGRGRETWLGHIIIDPAKRGSGLGFELTCELLRHTFVVREASRVSLIVFPDNAAAVNCYLRAGFQVVRTERHRPADSNELLSLVRLELTAREYAASGIGQRHRA